MTKEIMTMADNKVETGQGQSLSEKKLSYRQLELVLVKMQADPLGAAELLARRWATPTDEFVINASKLVNGKLEDAASLVSIPRIEIKEGQSGPLTKDLTKEEIDQKLEIFTAAAKLIASKDYLFGAGQGQSLSREKIEQYEGLIENILGLEAFAEGKGWKGNRRKFLVTAAAGLASILAACSGQGQSLSEATRIFSETQNALTEPAPEATAKASATIEPSPTPDPRFKELMPKTYKICMNDETHTINWETRYRDLAVLMKKVKEQFVFAPDRINEFWPSLTTKMGPIETELSPEKLMMTFENPNNIPLDTCKNIKMPSGKRLEFLVLPVRRHGSQIVVHLPLVFDFEAHILQNKIVYKRSLKINEVGQEDTYQQMKNGSLFSFTTSILLSPGSDQKTIEIWSDLLSLIPSEPNKATAYYQALEKYFLNSETYSDEQIKQLAIIIESNFLPRDYGLYHQ